MSEEFLKVTDRQADRQTDFMVLWIPQDKTHCPENKKEQIHRIKTLFRTNISNIGNIPYNLFFFNPSLSLVVTRFSTTYSKVP